MAVQPNPAPADHYRANPLEQSRVAMTLMLTMRGYDALGDNAKTAARCTIVMFHLKGARTHTGPDGIQRRRSENAAQMAFYGCFTDDERIEHKDEIEAGMTFGKLALSAAYRMLRNEHKSTD